MLSRRHVSLILVGLLCSVFAAPLQAQKTFAFERQAFGGWTVRLEIEQVPHAHSNGQWRARFVATGNPQNLAIGTISFGAGHEMADTGNHEASVNSVSPVTYGWFSPWFAGYPTNIARFRLRDPYGNWTNQDFEYGVGVEILEEQTVTVNLPGSNEWTVGQSKSGTATGAMGGNQYNFAIVSGNASIGGNSSTGAFTITANAAGPITYKVWASEGNGYSRSNDATGTTSVVVAEAQTGDPGEQKNTKPQVLKNPYGVPLTVDYIDSVTGKLLMTRTLQPGETLAFTLTKVGDNPVTQTFTLNGDSVVKAQNQFGNEESFIAIGGSTWSSTIPDSEFSGSRPTWEAPATVTPSIPPTQLTKVENPDPALPGAAQTPSTVVIGKAGAVQYSSAAAAGGATDESLREGVGAIVTKLGDIEKALGKSGSGGGTVTLNATGIETRIDTSNAELNAINQKLEALNAAQTARDTPGDVNTIRALAMSAADAAANEVQNKFQQEWATNVGNYTVSQQSAPAGSDNWPSFQIPLLGEIELSPSRLPWLIPILNAAREIILWLLVVAFIRTGLKLVSSYSLQVATVPQVNTTIAAQDLVPVAGQLFSWAKGTITAVLIVSFVVVAFGAGVGVINTGITFSGLNLTISSVMSGSSVLANALGSAASNPFWALIAEAFPLGAFLSLLTAELSLYLFMSPIFLGASFIVRAIRA